MYEQELTDMIYAAAIAKGDIMNVYKKHFNVNFKDDKSPVTDADLKADKTIKDYLLRKYPDYGFLTEESIDDKTRLDKDYVFIIDPLDGTSDFVNNNGEFTTNIALCYKHEIVVGVVMIPCSGDVYYAVKGKGAYKLNANKELTKIHVSNKTKNITCLTSRSHFAKAEEDVINKHKDVIAKVIPAGSSLKACLIAEGSAEISYRLSPGTKEWDTASFDIIVSEAGGFVLKPNGEPMVYNRENVYNLDGYVIVNEKENFLL